MVTRSGKSDSEFDMDLMSAIVGRSSDGIMAVDGQGKVVFANRAMRLSYGLGADGTETLRSWLKLVSSEDRVRNGVLDLWRLAGKKSDQQSADFEITPPGKVPVWCRFEVFGVSGTRTAIRLQDITELAEVAGRYRELVENLRPDALVIVQDGRIVFANTALTEMSGYSMDDLTGEFGFLEYICEDKREEVRRRYLDRIAGRKISRTHTFTAVTRGGRLIHCETSGTLIQYNGRPADLAILRDITERHAAEQALRESEAKFRDLAEQSPNMIFINLKGRVVYANRCCEEAMGYTREEFYGAGFDFLQLIATEDRGRIGNNMAQHSQGRDIPPYEYCLITRAGVRIESVIATKLIDFGGDKAILGIVTDVSDLRRAQRRLEQTALELSEQKQALENKNVALKEILAQIEAEKLLMRRQVATDLDTTVMPILRGLKKGAAAVDLKRLEIIEASLRDMTEGLGPQASQGVSSLTPTETEVSNLIRGGMSTKEMAALMHVSLRTIETHRHNIRRKLGLSKKGTNLTTYLRTLG